MKVGVVGSYGVGMSIAVDHAPAPGETVHGRDLRTGHGGKGSNQAIAARRLGAEVVLWTAVGTDPYASQARELWTQEGVDARHVVTLPGSTMIGSILVEEGGENRIVIAGGVLDDFTPAHLIDLSDHLQGCDALLVSLEIPLDTANYALGVARDLGVPTILNPAPAPLSPLTDDALRLVDHITPNRVEAARLAQLPLDADPSVLITAECFAPIGCVVLTLGADGALVRHGDELVKIDAPHVDVVDTTGAGDAFNGCYAVRIAAGDDPASAAHRAVRAAAHAVGHREVVPSLPFAHELAVIDADISRGD